MEMKDLQKALEDRDAETIKKLAAIEGKANKVDELKADLDATRADLTDLMQKTVRGAGPANGYQRETIGEIVTKGHAQELANLAKRSGRLTVEAKAIISNLTTDADGSAGDLLVPDRPAGIIELARRKLRVRQLFAQGRTNSSAIWWPRQTVRTIGAETQTQGATKGASEVRYDLDTWPVQTIAHFVVVAKQMLDDVAALSSYLDDELRYGLAYVEDNQLLNGGGTGTDLEGVYTTATAFSAPFVPTMAGTLTKIDVLLLAIAQVEAADYEADGIVMNPIDYRDIQLTKDQADNYIGDGPFGAAAFQRLWQLPCATTKAMTVDKFLVGAFREGAMIFDRQEATVEVSTEDSDNFRRNLCTVRGEERLAFVHKHDDAFVKGDFGDAIAA